MNQKTPGNVLENQLVAVATLLGIDKARDTLTRERERITATFDVARTTLMKMSITDFCDTLGLAALPKVEKKPTAPHANKPKTANVEKKPTAPHANKPKTAKVLAPPTAKPNGAMHDALAVAMKNGPRKLRDLIVVLHRQGIVTDTSAETRRQVIAFLTSDKTFARTKTGGCYAIRSRPA